MYSAVLSEACYWHKLYGMYTYWTFFSFLGSFKKVEVADSPKSFTQTFFFSLFSFLFFSINYLYYMKTQSQ